MKLATMAALIALFTLTACIPQANQPAANPAASPVASPTTEPTTEPLEAMMDAEGKVIPVQANNYVYDVKEIKAKQGEKVTVSFTNAEGFHDFVIDELEVNTGMVPAGQTVTVEIPTDKPGTYSFYCSVGDHRQKGMEGTLIIE